MEADQRTADLKKVVLMRDHMEQEGSGTPLGWAVEQLSAALKGRSITLIPQSDANSSGAEAAIRLVKASDAGGEAGNVPAAAEAFIIDRQTGPARTTIVIYSSGDRGFIYALLELADRIQYASDPMAELHDWKRTEEKPANKVRSLSRMFVSEAEDKPWYYDKAFWNEYLNEIARHRFNRFNLALGMGYDYGHDPDIRDNYMYFAYPFLLDVPGYDVRVEGLPGGEAARNLDMLRYIGEQVSRRGLDFHVGIWTNAYDLPDSPHPHYRITGLTKDNHAAYCRDALTLLLQSCTSIAGLTLRVHYESGIPEPAQEFWRAALSGIAAIDRPVSVDIHSKGVEASMIEMVRESTGRQVTVSPKFWAEHMGLPYHPAHNREREMPEADFKGSQYAAVTAGSRKVTRYGYADFLTRSRNYDILYRVWPGTQRVLLWGDPVMAAGSSRAASFGGAAGLELFEPLSFKGRKTSGIAGGRELYADEPLRLEGKDWIKYGYTYRLWGRLLYNPDTDPDVWRRYLRHEYGASAGAAEKALAFASRILPLITVAHHPSSANVDYWPEMYTNLAIIKTKPSQYDYDLPEPKTFGAASPLDPEMFYSINAFADAVISGTRSGKATPQEVSFRLDEWAGGAMSSLMEAEALADKPQNAAFRRLAADVRILAGLGRFFARKFQAGTAYALFERSNDVRFLYYALKEYHLAKEAWEQIIAAADGVYRSDIAFGHKSYMRGHWADRLPAITEDLEEMHRIYRQWPAGAGAEGPNETEIGEYVRPLRGPSPSYEHIQPESYNPGMPVQIAATAPSAPQELRIYLHYRHVNQAERFAVAEMERDGDLYRAVIPSSYTDSVYSLMYYLELDNGTDAWIAPGFDTEMAGPPYYVLHSTFVLRGGITSSN